LESFGSPLAGGPWSWTPFGQGPISYGAAPQLGVVLAWMLIAAFVMWAWARNERTLRALWAPAAYVAASIVLVYMGRSLYLVFLGSGQVGRQVQYFSDVAPIVALTVVSLMAPILGAVDPVRPRPGGSLIDLRARRRTAPILVATLALGLLASSLVSTVRYAEPWTSNYIERNFTTSARATIERERPMLADTVVPPVVLGPLSGERSLIRNYFAPMGDDVQVTTIGNDLRVLALDGSTVPTDVDAPDRADLDRTKSCPVRIAGRARTIRFPRVFAFSFWMAIDYRSDTSGVLPLVIGAERQQVPIEAGLHTLFVRTDSAYASVSLRPLVGQELCVSAVRVGQLVAP
ncbi:MAG: hypothetical protein ABWX60_07425, partial [Aeromicrobium sp.]